MSTYQSDGNERTSVDHSPSNSPAVSSGGVDPIATNRPASLTLGTSPVSRSRFGLAMAIMTRSLRRGGDHGASSPLGSSPPHNPPTGGGGAVAIGSSDASGGSNGDGAAPRPKLSLRLQKFVATRLRYAIRCP
jgi:hypothetical protein